ncbi:TldD/PmbA family protein [Pyrococcus furiosus DSM 3638]|uniref:TldD/PmbA family protein n=3 Tax=Pyrococcus furiosus TaxID=2261 RepID=A0A5C0XQT0_PYRFU|nr:MULTISPECIES: TldD/PmbA family protein [Pyrococcus]AAL81698.1 hypothetical protein PF1574 [Pyrococcus furiosus DSM 3638]AFN04356.1 hypothetical protein PFC_07100 [Pyrococcus furiosus COM1]MDK2869712.1 PmbA protein [Pyrococcus sp.]QEK79197.1 TldD/PmbA family protein [Pyrococcus furiosus DSM 3638]
MEELIRYGEKFFDELEIVTRVGKDFSVDIQLNEVFGGGVREDILTIIRGIKDKRIGIVLLDTIDKEEIKKGIETAAKMAKLNAPDEKWSSLPQPGKYREKPKISEDLKSASSDELVNMAVEGIKLARELDKNLTVAGGSIGTSWNEITIVNSHGINVTQELGVAYAFFEFVGRKEGIVTPGIFEFDAKDNLNLNIEETVKNGVKKVQWAYNFKQAKNEETTLIFGPWAISGLLNYALFPAFSGERLVKGTTPLADKVGERITSEVITLYDDPFHELSITKIIADGEGIPTRRYEIIKDGEFKGFIWDNYWAKVHGTESTGHGVRDWSGGGITIGLHVPIIENGKRSLEEIIGEIKHGYLVDGVQGAHSSNPDNGNFAVTANPAYIIENGEIVGSTVFLIAGNIYELLKKATEVSKEQRTLVGMTNVITPYIKFENVKIAGKS